MAKNVKGGQTQEITKSSKPTSAPELCPLWESTQESWWRTTASKY